MEWRLKKEKEIEIYKIAYDQVDDKRNKSNKQRELK